MNIHVIGIAGAGMIGIAEMLHSLGHKVTGSDLKSSPKLNILRQKGIEIFDNHNKSNIELANLVVTSSAVPDCNAEIIGAKELHIPIWSRYEALERLLPRHKKRISVIGSCGKTSLTAVIEGLISVYDEPTIYMGATSKLTGLSGNYRNGEYQVIESCEYKGSFNHLSSDVIILTDILQNHENYFGLGIEQASRAFANYVVTSGANKIYVSNDVKSNEFFMSRKFDCNIISYGVGSGDWRAEITSQNDKGSEFSIYNHNSLIGDFHTSVHGKHIVKHIVGAIAIAHDEGLSVEKFQQGIDKISLPDRRFQIKMKSNRLVTIDDNSRNPKQLDYTINCLFEHFPGKKIIAVCGIWGHLNARPLKEYIKQFSKFSTMFISELDEAAKSKGGPEEDNTVPRLISKLTKMGVVAFDGINCEEIMKHLCKLLEDNEVILLTFGFDKHKEQFDQIHNNARKLFITEGY